MKRILLDANLLVLLVVGLAGRNLIERHKRTKSFDDKDYDLLVHVLSNFDQIVVTPHILAEASNLCGQIPEPALTTVRTAFATLVRTQEETHLAASIGIEHNAFLRLGLTDSTILELVNQGLPLMTTDLDLYLAAAHISDLATNFNHVRIAHMIET